MLSGHERTKIDEPMDTIFVKQVRSNSPASEAGLRTGDRLVAVDGVPTRGEQYASVVQRIQKAGPWLRLLVVSKEDDILQRVIIILKFKLAISIEPIIVVLDLYKTESTNKS